MYNPHSERVRIMSANYSMLITIVTVAIFALQARRITFLQDDFMQKEPILVLFGRNVQNHRKALGLSQEQLADRAGVHRTYIGMIERAEKNITLVNIEKIAKAFGISIDSLFKTL